MNKAKFILLALLFVLPVKHLISSGGDELISIQGMDASYLRFENEGDYWKYDVLLSYNNTQYTLNVRIGGITSYRGQISTPYIYTSNLDGNTTIHNYRFSTEGRMYLGSFTSGGSEIAYDPGILLPYNFDGVLARSMSVSFVGDTDYPESDYTYTYAGNVTITLPGSTVPLQCAHLNFKYSFAKTRGRTDMQIDEDQWYASGLGLVKVEDYKPVGFENAGSLIGSWTLREARVGEKVFP